MFVYSPPPHIRYQLNDFFGNNFLHLTKSAEYYNCSDYSSPAHLSVCVVHGSIQPGEDNLPQVEEVAQDVQHPGHLGNRASF